jgi:hypothetical protein
LIVCLFCKETLQEVVFYSDRKVSGTIDWRK